MTKDYELWLAVHDDCPRDGCGNCSSIDLEWDAVDYNKIERAASVAGEAIDVFVLKALALAVESEGFGT